MLAKWSQSNWKLSNLTLNGGTMWSALLIWQTKLYKKMLHFRFQWFALCLLFSVLLLLLFLFSSTCTQCYGLCSNFGGFHFTAIFASLTSYFTQYCFDKTSVRESSIQVESNKWCAAGTTISHICCERQRPYYACGGGNHLFEINLLRYDNFESFAGSFYYIMIIWVWWHGQMNGVMAMES